MLDVIDMRSVVTVRRLIGDLSLFVLADLPFA